jgi:hypothetical protein
MERFFEIENNEGKKVRVVAINDIQASAYLNEGFAEVTEEEPKKKK